MTPMHFQSIEISNFRGIRTSAFKDFGRINLLLGENNFGKTSVLEALFLTLGISNPKLPPNIERIRGLVYTEGSDFLYLFHRLEAESEPRFEAQMRSGTKRTLALEPIFHTSISNGDGSTLQMQEADDISYDTGQGSRKVAGISLSFETDGVKAESRIFQQGQPNSFRYELAEGYEEAARGVFIPGNTPESPGLHRRIEKIIVAKKQADLIEVLKQVDDRIAGIELGGNLIYFDTGLDRLVPSSTMGDGTRRLLDILVTTLDTTGGVVLIDEIDNGLYYSALKTLWRAVLDATDRHQVQLFATTHSLETLEYLVEVLEEDDFNRHQSEVTAFTLRRDPDGRVRTYRYNFDQLEFSLEQEIEIR